MGVVICIILDTFGFWHSSLGAKRFSKSIWKSFKVDFAEIEEHLAATKDEVKEEVQLASEQAANNFRYLQMIEFEENRQYRRQQTTEALANKDFRSQQTLIHQNHQERQIQKLIKEEGSIRKMKQ